MARQLWRQTSCQTRQAGGKAVSRQDELAGCLSQSAGRWATPPHPITCSLINYMVGSHHINYVYDTWLGPSSCHEEVASDKLRHIRRVTRCQLICAKFLTNLQPLSELVGCKVLPETGRSVAWLPSCLSALADPLVSLFCNGAFERFQHTINRLGRRACCVSGNAWDAWSGRVETSLSTPTQTDATKQEHGQLGLSP